MATANVTISQPAVVLAVSTSQVNVLCFGSATGSAKATPTGGTAPYTYSWNTIPVKTTATAAGLTAGNYTVTVTDFNGCSAIADVIITQPVAALSVNTSQVNVLCFGSTTGSATATPAGGTAPYTYSWNTVPVKTTATASNLAAGNYTVTVIDNNGCTALANVIITQPEVLTGSITAQTNVTAFEGSDGSVTVAGLGGSSFYQYKLDAGLYQVSGTFTSLTKGLYMITVQDINLCTYTIPVVITQPSIILTGIITSQTNVPCFGGNTGSIKVEASGGDAPYEYKLNNSPYQVSGTFDSLTAGAYTVTVRDAKGKTSGVPVTITQPSLLTVSTIKTDILCEGESTGSASALAQGGTSPYSYSWNTLPVMTTATATGLTAGTYSVIVTDVNGCTATAPATIVALNSLPTAAFTSSQSGLNTYTFVNTSVNATSYTWDFGDGQTSTIANPIHVYAKAGTYTVKLTVANSCGTDIETQVLTVPELEFFNGFSPNGDGQNDNWNIPVLNYYPVNRVLIINRWGSEIWKGFNYNNNDVVWTGKNMNGEDMPDGTYYYIINYDNTEKRGWVFIKR
jgi:gliding motility-associated-like protein